MGVIHASIPLFFLLFGAELLWRGATGRRVLRLNDSISDSSCGILSQLAGVFTKLFPIGIFMWVGASFTVQHRVPAMPAWRCGRVHCTGRCRGCSTSRSR